MVSARRALSALPRPILPIPSPRVLRKPVLVACLIGLSLIGGPGNAGSDGISALQARVFSDLLQSMPRAAVQMKAVQAEACYSAVTAAVVFPNSQPLSPPVSPAPAPLQVAPPVGNAAATYGIATWYGGVDGFDLGDGMADGSPFNPDDPTIAASNQWPLGTRLLVCHGERCIEVCVRDRGAFGHSLDLSRGAFALLAPLSTGVIDVVVHRIS